MGYSYQGRKLCCDLCGTAGAKKVPCPFGYCQPIAACPKCRKERKERFTKAMHKDCEVASLKMQEDQTKQDVLEGQGFHVRRSAYEIVQGVCQVWGRASDSERAVYMPTSVYQSFALGEVVTLEQFEEKAGVFLPVAPLEHLSEKSKVLGLQALDYFKLNGF